MTRRELWELIGRVGVGKDVNGIISFFLPNSAYIIKKKITRTEQASNEAVAKKSWEYLFANCTIHKFVQKCFKNETVYTH